MTDDSPPGQRFAWERRLLAAELPSTTKLVGLALATHLNASRGTAWPGAVLLATECSLSERAVRNHLKTLEQIGAIERRGASHGAAHKATEWALLPSSWPSPTVGEAPNRNLTAPQPEPDGTPTGTGVPLNTKENTKGTTSGGPEQEDLGSGDDLSEDHRSELVVLEMQTAQTVEALAAVRAANLWAFGRGYVEEAHRVRLDQLDPLPEFLR